MYDVHRLQRVLVNGNIHYCLAQAFHGHRRNTELRHTQWSAAEIQRCLVMGWLTQEKPRGPYEPTLDGAEMLHLLGPYEETKGEWPFFAWVSEHDKHKPEYIPVRYAKVPTTHKTVRKWVKFFQTRIW